MTQPNWFAGSASGRLRSRSVYRFPFNWSSPKLEYRLLGFVSEYLAESTLQGLVQVAWPSSYCRVKPVIAARYSNAPRKSGSSDFSGV